jgi:hypothetical protein
MVKFADLGPLYFGDAVCSQCGEVMARNIVLNRRGQAEKVVYVCENPETGCSYQVESDQRLSGMQQAVTK